MFTAYTVGICSVVESRCGTLGNGDRGASEQHARTIAALPLLEHADGIASLALQHGHSAWSAASAINSTLEFDGSAKFTHENARVIGNGCTSSERIKMRRIAKCMMCQQKNRSDRRFESLCAAGRLLSTISPGDAARLTSHGLDHLPEYRIKKTRQGDRPGGSQMLRIGPRTATRQHRSTVELGGWQRSKLGPFLRCLVQIRGESRSSVPFTTIETYIQSRQKRATMRSFAIEGV